MKKIFLSLALGLSLTTPTFANKVDREARKEARKEKKEVRIEKRNQLKKEVSFLTEDQFSIDFPKATDVSFERSDWFDEASYTLDGKQYRAYYDIMSQLIGATTKVSFTDLPKTAQDEINKRFAEYEVKEVIMFDDNEFNESDMIFYGASFEDADNYFVQLEKADKNIVIKVTPEGVVSYFTQIKKAS